MLQMRREPQRLQAPVAQAKQRPYANATKTARITAFRARQPPVEVLLRPRRVHLLVHNAIIRLLIDHEPFRARLDHALILRCLHRSDLDANRRHEITNRPDAFLQVAIAHEFGMLPRHEQDVPKTLRQEMLRLRHDLIHRERHAQDRVVVARKAAVAAVVHAFVRDIQRREQPHRSPKVPPRDHPRLLRHRLDLRRPLRLQQGRKALHQRRFTRREGIERGNEGGGHGRVSVNPHYVRCNWQSRPNRCWSLFFV